MTQDLGRGQQECPCFYPDPNQNEDPNNCTCGHALDEHDNTGQCQATETEDYAPGLFHTPDLE